MVIVSTKDNRSYGTKAHLDQLKIIEKTFHFHESFRAVRFTTAAGDEVTIPFENINIVSKTES